MDRLSIVLVLLGVSRIQAALYCGGSMANKCVQGSRCRVGSETGIPIIDYRGFTDGNLGCETGETCCPVTKILQFPAQMDHQADSLECGHVNRLGVGLATTNEEGELPWMVALLDARNSEPIGAGSLIRPDVVLTSASKTYKTPLDYLIVRAGEWDLKGGTEQQAHQDVPIEKIVRHPRFNVENGAYNAALLFLSRSLRLDRHINLICLPQPNRNLIKNLCIVSGWTQKDLLSNGYMNVLKKIEVPLVERSVCQRQLQEVAKRSVFLDESMMCAGGEPGKDLCSGNGGAALVCPLQSDPNRYEQVGIVNFGIGCGMPVPVVYTDVSKIHQWIVYSIEENTVDHSSQLGNVGQSPVPNVETPIAVQRQAQGSFQNVGFQTGYDPNRIQETKIMTDNTMYKDQGNGVNGYNSFRVQGYIPNVGQGNNGNGNGYYPNGSQNPNRFQGNYASNQVGVEENKPDMGGRKEFGILGGATANPNKYHVITFDDITTTTTTSSSPVQFVIEKA
ncbi:phenoloxidase-activating factor 2 [Drosophila erecta]|uniref:Peptidase S1 domain-containing protein n=1 Tax=Drosophila erecta TaxID=7220 RepID=B3N630_DROER|nr:phenoloxidase-activating factor 2 [Drosophila erecta]EDV58068.2 uncharacterized protein Dere_GG25180 [Drosophila erecta]